MSTTNAYSDLIHLFIDGEATETERNTLFGALKDSPELQEEFHSAMELKKAFAADIMQLQPPSYLQSQIAERAGLIVAASASVATAPAVVNSLSTSISSALTTAAPIAVSKGLIALAIGTSVGILSTIGIIKLTSSPEVVAPTFSRSETTESRLHSSLVAPDKIEIQSAPDATYMSDRSNTTNTLRSAAPLASIHSAKAMLNQSNSISREESKDNTSASKTTEVVANNSQMTEYANKSLDILAAITPVIIPTPSIKAIGSDGSNHGFPHLTEAFNKQSSDISRFSIKIQGIGAAHLNQGSNNIAMPLLNNFGVGFKYDLDPSNAIAIEAGQETFPVYLANGDNRRLMTWVGGSWNYSAIFLEMLGIHPEIRGLIGESNVGPIGKFSIGLAMPVSTGISISSGVEYTGLMINVNGTATVGTKLALTAAFTFHF